MPDGPDSTAVRVALWRAMHVQLDAPPHLFDDEIGLRLVAPDEDWRSRGDMHPQGTRGYRASIVARARFIEDLLLACVEQGVDQYVVLGSGLDTFAQRRPDIGARLRIFDVDRPEPQAWKRERLIELGYGIPEWLQLVAVDFESGASEWEQLAVAGFDARRPAFVASTGVSLYLTQEANAAALRRIAALAPGSTLAMTFLLPPELVDAAERPAYEAVIRAAAAAGTPFISLYAPEEMLATARAAGFRDVRHVSTADLTERYFAARTDGLRPSTGESFLIART